jgi:TatD DNase family protein
MAWIDTHAHLADEAFRSQLANVLERARLAGVSELLCVAVDRESSDAAIEISQNHPQVWATAGVHPNYAHLAAESDWERVIELSADRRVVALGETGLDLHWDDCPFPIQQQNFSRHWELSRITDLPLIIHMRDCESEMISALESERRLGPLRGVMHSFAGSAETAAACLGLGLYISFAGMLTYKKSDALREVARTIPLDRLLVETDSPYLSPEPHRSKRPNEPANVVYTAKCLAETLGIRVQELSEITRSNTKTLFSRMTS